MKTLSLLIGIIVGLSAATASGQTLWQKAQVGMTPEQVKAAFPDEKWDEKNRQPEITTTIAEQPFKVFCSYESSKLKAVMLDLRAELGASEAESTFKKLVTALREKYGQEVAVTNDGGLRRASWKTPDGASVQLSWLGLGHRNAMNVTYSTALNREADKL